MIQIFKNKPVVNTGKPSLKEFKRLDRTYTRPEYEKLLSMLSFSILSVMLKALLKNNIKNIRKSHGTNYKYLSEYIYGTSMITYQFIYQHVIDDLPMHINHNLDVVKAVIKWRMEINK